MPIRSVPEHETQEKINNPLIMKETSSKSVHGDEDGGGTGAERWLPTRTKTQSQLKTIALNGLGQ